MSRSRWSKKLHSALICGHLANFGEDGYTSAAADNIKDARRSIETEFE